MSTWLNNYAKNLDTITGSADAYVASRGSDKDNVYKVLSMFGSTPDIYKKMALEPYKSGGGGVGGFLSSAGSKAKSLGMGALDIMSRPNYMMANLASTLTQNSLPGKPDATGGDLLKAAWAGLSGKKKETFADVLKEHGVTGFLGGAGGLLLDIGLDPTTYVGAGLIKDVASTGIKVGEKVLGREVTGQLPKFGRAKNALTTTDVVKPGDEIAKAGEETVKVDSTPTTLPYDITPETNVSRLLAAEPQGAKFIAGSEGIESNVAAAAKSPTTTAKIALSDAEKARNELLQGVSSRRYAKDFQVEPLRVNEASRLEPNPTFGTAGNDSIKASIHTLVDENLAADRQFNLYGRSHITQKPTGKIHPAAVVGMIKNGKVPKDLENAHFKVGGRKVSVKQYVEDAHGKYIEADTAEMPHVKIDAKSRVMSPTERAAWVAKHREHLDPEDMKVLIRAANLGEGQYKKAFEKIKNKTVYKDYESIDALEAAHKAGMISDTGRQVLEQRSLRFGRKNIGPAYRAAHKKVEDFQKAIDKAVADPTEANVIAARKAQQEAVKIEESNKFAGRDSLTPDLVEQITKDATLQDNVAQNVENLMEHGEHPEGWVKQRAQLNEWQAKNLEEVLPEVSKQEMNRAANAKKTTNTGAKREVPAGVKGPAWHMGFNKYSQFTLGKNIALRASRQLAKMGVKAADRPAAMYDMVMPMLEASDAVLRQNGIPLILGAGARGLPMSLHDALSALPRDFVEKYFFSGIDATKGARSADFTQMADIVEQYLMKGLGKKSDQQVREALKVLLKKPTRSGKGQSALNISVKSNKDMDAVIKEFDAAFSQAGPEMIKALRNNEIHAAVKEGQQTKALTKSAMLAFDKVISDPNSTTGEIIRASLESNKVIDEASKLMQPPPSNAAVNTAAGAATAHIATQVDMPVVATFGRVATRPQNTAADVAKLSTELSDASSVGAKVIIQQGGGSAADLGKVAEFGFGVRLWSTIAGHLGVENLRPILMQRLSVNQTNAKRFSKLLNQMNSRHTPAQLEEAFARLQRGEEIDNRAMQDLQSVMKELFDKDPEYGLLKRNAITAEELQAKFDHFKIPNHYVLDPANLDQSWKTWTDVKDPLNLLSKFNAAVFSVVSEKELGAEIGRMFGQHAPGATGKWVQIIDTGGKSKLHKVLVPGLYYPEDIARQMHMIDITLDQLAKGSWNNSFFKVADSVTHAYKAGVTIYRPGHHARNLFGDLWLSSIGDGVSLSAYRRGFAAIATASSHYKDFDALRSLQAAYIHTGGVPPKSLVRMRFNGKDVHLSPEQIYKMAYDNGVLPDYSVLEDIAFGTTAQADKVANTLRKVSPARGKVHDFATTASEYRDHYVRLSHFIHALDKQASKGKSLTGKTLEDALMNAAHEAAGRVRKWHPDGSDLTHMEKNVMRRTVLFYSWVRKAMPLVVEGMVTKPGKVMVYPKAMTNWAAANGIDLQGHTGFPEDQLFPDFIADGAYLPTMGGAGHYLGVQPGIPSLDILNDYGGTPQGALQSLMGGLNPALRVPPEVATGTSMRTGGPIMDRSDYIDQLIPGGNYIDKLAGGRSLSTAFTQPNRVAKSNEGYAPDFPGGKGGMDFLNWLTGLGVSDYSVPSYQKAAQIQQGNR